MPLFVWLMFTYTYISMCIEYRKQQVYKNTVIYNMENVPRHYIEHFVAQHTLYTCCFTTYLRIYKRAYIFANII